MKEDYWRWGGLETGKITCHDIIHTNAIAPYVNKYASIQGHPNYNPNYQTPDKIEFYATLRPHPSAPTKDLGASNAYWGSCFFGKIMCNDIVHTNSISSLNGTGSIQSYTNIEPTSTGQAIKNLGGQFYRWSNLYVNNIVDRNNSTGSNGQVLARDNNGLVWQNVQAPVNVPKMCCGQNDTTGSGSNTGFATVTFPADTFPSGTTPRVVATAVSYSGNQIVSPVVCHVFDITHTGFSIRTHTIGAVQHKHRVGNISGTYGWGNPTRSKIVTFRESDGVGYSNVQGVLAANMDGDPRDLWSEDWVPSGNDMGFVGKNVRFHWIAMAP